MLSLYSLNMDIFNKLSHNSPHIYFKEKVRLSESIWCDLYFDSLHILYGKNVDSGRISGTSEDYTRSVLVFVYYEGLCKVRRYF